MRLARRILTLAFTVFSLTLGASFALPICEPGYICQCSSPIVIDIDGKGFFLTDAINGVSFDIAGNGKPVQIAWTTPSARNAWLALDRNGNGTIDNGQELFGNFTPQPDCKQPNGFLALAEYDKAENGGNGDGIIDDRDAVYHSLRLWIDANHNGISEPDELHTLPELGVVSLSLDYKTSVKRDRYGNMFRYRGRVNPGVRDSQVGPFAFDVFLSTRPNGSSAPNAKSTAQQAVKPDEIPLEILYSFFLRRASCTDADPELHKLKCRLVQKSVGLNAEDESRISPHVEGIRDDLLAIDSDVVKARRATDDDSKNRASVLEKQRSNLIQNKIAALKQDLSPEGQQAFDAYIERMKKKIRFVPAPAEEAPNAN